MKIHQPPEHCAYCGNAPAYESVWVDNDGKVIEVWLCAHCDERGLHELMDFFVADPAVPGSEFGPD